MLLFIAFVMFAALMTAWLVLPDNAQTVAPKPVEKLAPESGTMPARA
ncbi:MAG: hypothetical protein M3457_08925 [Chloroflexota bacterium]|nr:hypothetical protein [Chloroflexota bacterium]